MGTDLTKNTARFVKRYARGCTTPITIGSLVTYRVGDTRELGRVLGLAKHDGMGKRYPKKDEHLVVLQLSENGKDCYERHIPIADVDFVHDAPKTATFIAWFMTGSVKDLKTIQGLLDYGALNSRFLDKFMKDGQLNPDWRDHR